MTDNINKKIINLFDKHKKQVPMCDDEKVVRNEDGFYYVCVTKDDADKILNEDKLLDKYAQTKYIIKVLIKNEGNFHLYNFLVPSEKLMEFLDPYVKHEKEGDIVDIEKYFPDELA